MVRRGKAPGKWIAERPLAAVKVLFLIVEMLTHTVRSGGRPHGARVYSPHAAPIFPSPRRRNHVLLVFVVLSSAALWYGLSLSLFRTRH